MLSKICNVCLGIIIIVMAIFAAVLLIPRILGYQSLAVLSGSMSPEIPVGSIVFTEEIPFEEFKVGDIVTYSISEKTMVTHRITKIDKQEKILITRGDANDSEDAEPVEFTRVKGKADFHVPFLGYLSIYLRTPIGIAAICGLLFVLILLFFLPEIFHKDERSENTRENCDVGIQPR